MAIFSPADHVAIHAAHTGRPPLESSALIGQADSRRRSTARPPVRPPGRHSLTRHTLSLLQPGARSRQEQLNVHRICISSSLEKGGGNDGVGGNKQVQDMLADMVRLQSGKVRVTEFVDEKAQFLSDIADDAKQEFSKIAETALKGMDAAGEKVLEKVDAEAQAFELELAAAREQIEKEEQDFAEFEKNVEAARNEGLFFKSLYRSVKPKANSGSNSESRLGEDTVAALQANQRRVSSKGRKLLYTCLAVLCSFGFVEAMLASEFSLQKVLLYGALSAALLAQLFYESVKDKGEKDGDM